VKKKNSMRNIIQNTILILLLCLPHTFVAAQEAGVVSLGEGGDHSYTTSMEEDGTIYYFDDDSLIVSEHDVNGDGRPDLWVVYAHDSATLEAHDTDADGEPDAFFELSESEAVVNMYGQNISQYDKPQTVSFEELISGEGVAATDEDLAGDLSSITIPGGGGGFVWLFVLAIGGGFVYYIIKKKKNDG